MLLFAYDNYLQLVNNKYDHGYTSPFWHNIIGCIPMLTAIPDTKHLHLRQRQHSGVNIQRLIH